MSTPTATPPPRTTTISFEWIIDPVKVSTSNTGYDQSIPFGTETAQFYLRAGADGSYYLHLAGSNQECFHVQLRVQVWRHDEYYSYEGKWNFSGDISMAPAFNRIGSPPGNTFNWNTSTCLTQNSVTFLDDPNKPLTLHRLQHYEQLSQALGTFRPTGRFSDIVLVSKLDGRRFPAHKILLASRSSVFASMFTTEEYIESRNGQVEIGDMKGEVLEALLEYIYTGKMKDLGPLTGELFVAADMYDIPLLAYDCLQVMLVNIAIENAAYYLYLAELHGLAKLKSKARCFIQQHRDSVEKTSGWKQYLVDGGRGELLELLGNK